MSYFVRAGVILSLTVGGFIIFIICCLHISVFIVVLTSYYYLPVK